MTRCFSVLALVCITTIAISQQTVPVNERFVSSPTELLPALAKGHPNSIQAQWSSIADMPGGKGYNAAVYYNGAVYTFGGIGSDRLLDLKSYKYDIATSTWSTIASLPNKRGVASAQVVNGKIYIIGGYSATSPFTTERAVLEYDPATNTYATKATIPMGVFGAGSFVHQGRIFILGGGSSGFSTSNNSIQIYDPAQDKWTFSASLTPYAAWAMGVAAIGDQVLYVGGVRYVSGSGTFGPWAYKGIVNGDDITWTQIQDYPGGSIMRHSCGTDGQKIYFAGGYDAGSQNNGPPSGKTFSYDLTSNSWTTYELKPLGVYLASPMVYDGQGNFYVLGGNDTPNSFTAKCEKFTPAVEGKPRMTVSTNILSEWVKVGGSARLTFTIKSLGGAPLQWSATSDQSWLSLMPNSGTIEVGKENAIAVTVDGSKLTGGAHSANLTLTSNDPDNSSYVIAVQIKAQNEEVDTEVNVLMEEGTGTWCGYCPYGADSLTAVIARYPGRVNGISYHGGHVTEPMQTPATNFWTGVIKLTGWPQGSVNRIVFDGESAAALSRGFWNAKIKEVIETRRSPISITVKSKTYNPQTKRIDMSVEVFFHRDMNVPIRLNIAQVQDQMNYGQVFYPPTGGSTLLYPYFHNHVLRQVIPSNAGEEIAPGSNIASQTSIVKDFSFTSVDSTIETSRFILFAHVSNGTTFGEILQSEEIALSQFITDVEPLPINATFQLHQNYPNPFNPSTMVSFDLPSKGLVTLVVTDAMGREVARLADGVHEVGRHTMAFNANTLPSGTYFLTLRAGNFLQTRTMTLMK